MEMSLKRNFDRINIKTIKKFILFVIKLTNMLKFNTKIQKISIIILIKVIVNY